MTHTPKPPPRPINGLLLLNKPLSISSNRALQQLKRLFAAAKAGHTGSLDPLATGMLPICLGEATKFSQYLLDADKEYRVKARLGIQTETGDAEGKIISQRTIPTFTHNELVNLLKNFTGKITQIPPRYSALKHEGQPLYKLARAGKDVEIKSRQVNIYSFEDIDCDAEHISFRVRVSKGTYIRTLVEDIGNALGCGAFVTELHRTQVAGYDEKQMWEFSQLETIAEKGFAELDKCLLAIDEPLKHWPSIHLDTVETRLLCQGQIVNVKNIEEAVSGLTRLYFNEYFLGMGEIKEENKLIAHRLVDTRSIFALLSSS